MRDWRSCRLGELLHIKHGYAFSGEHFGDTGTHIVLTPGNFYDEGGFKQKFDKEKWYGGPIPDEYVLSEGDLLVAMTEQAEGLLGSSAIVPESGLYLHNQRLGLVQIRDERETDTRFIYYLFNSKPVRQQIRASASGAKIRHTAPSRIAEVRVAVPPLPMQRRIAGILSAYDELIENNRGRIRILEEMARALYREWFVQFQFPQDRADDSRKAGRLHKIELVDSALGFIPSGWTVKKLGDITTVERTGINPFEFPTEEFEHFSIPAFDASQKPWIELGADVLSGKYQIDEACVLLSKLNPRIPRIWLAEPGSRRRAICSTEFLVLKPKSGSSREFIYSKLCSGEFSDQFSGLAIGTSTSHQRVKPDDLLAMPTLIPDPALVKRFSVLVEPTLSLAHQLRLGAQNLRRTRDLLLPRLLSGQIPLEPA